MTQKVYKRSKYNGYAGETVTHEANDRAEELAKMATFASGRGVFVAFETSIQSYSFKYFAVESWGERFGASRLVTYLGAFVDNPIYPKPVQLYTTLPLEAREKLKRARPECVSTASDQLWFRDAKGTICGNKKNMKHSQVYPAAFATAVIEAWEDARHKVLQRRVARRRPSLLSITE